MTEVVAPQPVGQQAPWVQAPWLLGASARGQGRQECDDKWGRDNKANVDSIDSTFFLLQ